MYRKNFLNDVLAEMANIIGITPDQLTTEPLPLNEEVSSDNFSRMLERFYNLLMANDRKKEDLSFKSDYSAREVAELFIGWVEVFNADIRDEAFLSHIKKCKNCRIPVIVLLKIFQEILNGEEISPDDFPERVARYLASRTAIPRIIFVSMPEMRVPGASSQPDPLKNGVDPRFMDLLKDLGVT